MTKRSENRPSPMRWLQRLFRQPPNGFYGQPCIYWRGKTLEVEHFRRIRTYSEEKLCLELGRRTLTIYGDGLRIETLGAHRITLRGEILRTDFSDE